MDTPSPIIGPAFEDDDRPSLRTLRADLRLAARDLGVNEVRYLVDRYYQLQDYRKATANQARAVDATEEPHRIIDWVKSETGMMEQAIKAVLDTYTNADPDGVAAWARSVYGIGPVISAGLLAHIDITQAPTVGHIWRYAGLDPTDIWNKGEKRPWNAALKTLCWKIGDSFVKFSNRDDCFFGKVYRERKALEVERNLAGRFADQAAASLTGRNWKDKEVIATLNAGRLPDGRIDLRARRYATKLFLAEWHEEAYVRQYGTLPPKPYAIDHLNHAHERSFPDASERVRALRIAAGRPVVEVAAD